MSFPAGGQCMCVSMPDARPQAVRAIMTLAEARQAVKYCNSYDRLPTILQCHERGLSRRNTWRLFCDEWTGCDNIWQYEEALDEILPMRPARSMMLPSEWAALQAL